MRILNLCWDWTSFEIKPPPAFQFAFLGEGAVKLIWTSAAPLLPPSGKPEMSWTATRNSVMPFSKMWAPPWSTWTPFRSSICLCPTKPAPSTKPVNSSWKSRWEATWCDLQRLFFLHESFSLGCSVRTPASLELKTCIFFSCFFFPQVGARWPGREHPAKTFLF